VGYGWEDIASALITADVHKTVGDGVRRHTSNQTSAVSFGPRASDCAETGMISTVQLCRVTEYEDGSMPVFFTSTIAMEALFSAATELHTVFAELQIFDDNI
jgi:hypothetical protein